MQICDDSCKGLSLTGPWWPLNQRQSTQTSIHYRCSLTLVESWHPVVFELKICLKAGLEKSSMTSCLPYALLDYLFVHGFLARWLVKERLYLSHFGDKLFCVLPDSQV